MQDIGKLTIDLINTSGIVLVNEKTRMHFG